MTKILCAGGDSFTFGSELSDSDNSVSNLSWAALLAQKLNYEYRCVAKPGCGNHAIARKVINCCEYVNVDLVAVMWTFPSRHEISLREDIADSGKSIELVNQEIDENWINLVHWQALDYNEKLPRFGENLSKDVSFQNKLKQQCDWHRKVGIYNIAKNWFEIANKNYFNVMTLQSIILLQTYLEKRNIPFVFSSATDQVFELINKETEPLAKIIDKKYWINEIGFYDWALLNNYPISPMNHPVDQAHEDWIKIYYSNWK